MLSFSGLLGTPNFYVTDSDKRILQCLGYHSFLAPSLFAYFVPYSPNLPVSLSALQPGSGQLVRAEEWSETLIICGDIFTEVFSYSVGVSNIFLCPCT